MYAMQTRERIIAVGLAVVSTYGCEAESPMHSGKRIQQIFVKHELQTQKKGAWKAETWIGGYGYVIDPVNVWLRLTPLDNRLLTVPKATLHLKLVHKKMAYEREATLAADFLKCSEMPRRLEYARWSSREGPQETFPPKDHCWEAKLIDALHSDPRTNAAAVPVERGDYDLFITATIQVQPPLTFEFDPIPMSFYLDRGDLEKSLKERRSTIK